MTPKPTCSNCKFLQTFENYSYCILEPLDSQDGSRDFNTYTCLKHKLKEEV